MCYFLGRAAIPVHCLGGRQRKASRKALTSFLKSSDSLIATISSGSSFLRREAVGKNVLSWPVVFEGGIATAAVRRGVDALVVLCSSGGGRYVLLSNVGASPWYISI